MKNLFFSIAIACILLLSCNNAADNNTGNASGPNIKNKKITSRDYSITIPNAYNDLFLDSAVMEKFIVEKKIPDSVEWGIRSFYNSRNFEFAWFSSDGLTEQARGFWNLHNNYASSTDDTTLDNKALQKRMDKRIIEDSLFPSAKDKSIVNTEILLTSHFIRHTLLSYKPDYVKRKEMERFIPARKNEALYLADSLLKKKHKDDKYYENVNPSYGLLKEKLAMYYDIQKKGGWPAITGKKKSYKKGTTDPEIALIKKRLQLTGDMPVEDTSRRFNDTLVAAVKKFQQRHGLKTDGMVTEATIKEMNVFPLQRIQQILINMERMRWLPIQSEGNLIIVNIPAFILHVKEGNKNVFDMDIVVGKEGHDTRIFTGNLNQVVFSPYWNVPPNIVRKEILPAIEKDKNYLEKQNMEVTGETDGLPGIRQLPGGENALGKVKFLFPNSFNIYFHDTPSKS